MRISITDVQSMSSTNRSKIARTGARQPKWRHIADQGLKDETGKTVTPDFKKGRPAALLNCRCSLSM